MAPAIKAAAAISPTTISGDFQSIDLRRDIHLRVYRAAVREQSREGDDARAGSAVGGGIGPRLRVGLFAFSHRARPLQATP